MQKTDHFFIKLVIVLVIAILALVTIVFFMQNDWKMTNPVNWSFNKNAEEKMMEEEKSEIGVVEDKVETKLPNRRYIEMKKSICDEGVLFVCEDYEFEFSDETGCGCELTEDYIAELETRINEDDLPLEEDFVPGNADNMDLKPCTREYMPVCGMKDGEYKTFGNDCMAEADGIYNYTEGECDINPEMPIICTMEYAPVCGVKDGEYVTFGNDCMAEGAGVFDYTEGECEKPEPVCGNGIIEGNEACDGDALRPTGFTDDDVLIWGCQPGSDIICSCNSDCMQTCHCEE